MILKFSVQNFGCIRQRQTLDFEADKSDHLEESYVVVTAGKRILKLALVFGANASGKTMLLKALDFLRGIVLKPFPTKTETFDFKPFLFDAESPRQNTHLGLEFVWNETRYRYEVELSRQAIWSEELYFYKPNKALVFSRKSHPHNQLTEIKFGSKMPKDKTLLNALEANTLWNNTVLGGFLKTNMDFKELQEVIDWFTHQLKPMVSPQAKIDQFVTKSIRDNAIGKAEVVALLRKADLNISDIAIEERDDKIPPMLLELLRQQAKSTGEALEFGQKDSLTRLEVEVEHTVEGTRYRLPFEEESVGTRRYYGFAGLLALLVSKPTILPVDELEASLHPELYQHFLLSFLLNAKQSQLIATTHNREILDDRDLFRDDAIWFTDKGPGGATQLYSLYDFDSDTIRDTTNVLNAYKSGKLSATPRLGDTFIDFEP